MNRNKTKKLPKSFQPGFLARLDNRLEVAQVLHAAFEEVTDDMGGMVNLSHAQKILAERFVFLEHFLRQLEVKIMMDPKEHKQEIGRWIQAINSLSGLAKTIGIERKIRKVKDIESYVKERERKHAKR